MCFYTFSENLRLFHPELPKLSSCQIMSMSNYMGHPVHCGCCHVNHNPTTSIVARASRSTHAARNQFFFPIFFFFDLFKSVERVRAVRGGLCAALRTHCTQTSGSCNATTMHHSHLLHTHTAHAHTLSQRQVIYNRVIFFSSSSTIWLLVYSTLSSQLPGCVNGTATLERM